MGYALRNIPVEETAAPEGVVNVGGEWYFEEYSKSSGVPSVGLDDKAPQPPTDEERKSILDLFKH